MKREYKHYQIDERFSVNCVWEKTRYGFRHQAYLLLNGNEVAYNKCCYYNRTWESYEYQSVIHGAIRGFYGKDKDSAEDLCKRADDSVRGQQPDPFRMVKAMCALGEIMGQSTEEKVNFKKKMIGTIPGIDFPDDFDSLPEEEKKRRIDGAIETLK